MNDQVLISAMKEGDQSAFAKMIDLHKDMVYNTCLGFVQQREDAEDLTQEVFIEVLRSIGNFQSKSKLSTWIYRISVNKSLDLLRSRKRKKRYASLTSIFGTSAVETVAGDFQHPGVVMEKMEISKFLFEAIDKLPESQKTAFVLHKVEGVSYKEIAEVMDTSLSSVESLIHRAKRNLKKSLAGFYEKNML